MKWCTGTFLISENVLLVDYNWKVKCVYGDECWESRILGVLLQSNLPSLVQQGKDWEALYCYLQGFSGEHLVRTRRSKAGAVKVQNNMEMHWILPFLRMWHGTLIQSWLWGHFMLSLLAIQSKLCDIAVSSRCFSAFIHIRADIWEYLKKNKTRRISFHDCLSVFWQEMDSRSSIYQVKFFELKNSCEKMTW